MATRRPSANTNTCWRRSGREQRASEQTEYELKAPRLALRRTGDARKVPCAHKPRSLPRIVSVGGFEINDELEFGRLHDRQSGRLFALENPASVDTNLAKRIGQTGSIAHQPAIRTTAPSHVRHDERAD